MAILDLNEKANRFRMVTKRLGVPDDIVEQFIASRMAMEQRVGGDTSATLRGTEPIGQPTTPSPTPPTKTFASAGGNYMDLIKKYFPQSEWERAYNVMMGESGGRPQAIGDDYPIAGVYAPSYGLFQIRGLPGRPAKEQLFNPEFNVKYAADMWKSQGWQPWTVARNLGYVY